MEGGAQPGRFVKKYRFRRTGNGINDMGSNRKNADTKHIERRIEDFDLEPWLKNTKVIHSSFPESVFPKRKPLTNAEEP